MKLSHLLRALREELQVLNNPDRRATASLKPSRYGWTAEPYSDEAFQIWSRLRSDSLSNLQTLHHLAIMHHARAFDFEQSTDPARADADWKQSLELWHQLYNEPRFWKGLSRRSDEDIADCFEEVCLELPEQLLQIHFDIAYDGETKHYRRRKHVELALTSPFAQETKDRVRLCAYERWVSDLPPTVWSADMLDSATLQVAITRILEYLDLDEEFLDALADLVALLTNLLTSKVQQANAAEAGQEHDRRVNEIHSLGARYEAHITRLEHALGMSGSSPNQGQRTSAPPSVSTATASGPWISRNAPCPCGSGRKYKRCHGGQGLVAETGLAGASSASPAPSHSAGKSSTLDDATESSATSQNDLNHDTLAKVSRWHSLIGQASHLVRDFDGAANHYRLALVAARMMGSDRELINQLERDWATWVAGAALNHVTKGEEGRQTARDKLQTIEVHKTFAPLGLFFRAQVYVALDDLDAGERDAKRALAAAELESGLGDQSDYQDATAVQPQLRVLLKTIDDIRTQKQVRPYLEAGKKAMDQRRWDVAVQQFDNAERFDAENFAVLLCRAQALHKMDDLHRARADLDTADRLALAEGIDEMRNAVNDVRREFARQEELFKDYGGVVAFRLRQRAIEAHNGGSPQEAVRLLREALQAARRGTAQAALKKELSLCLNAAGVEVCNNLNEWFKRDFTITPSHIPILRICDEAEALFREALEFDRTNSQARTNLESVQAVKGNFDRY